MILDNENENGKVFKWFKDHANSGKLKLVTGYFSINALAFLIRLLNDKTSEFHLVLGDFINSDEHKTPSLDLINEDLAIETALNTNVAAKLVVDFLKQDKVEVKTLEPNFCHAKAYIFESEDNDRCKSYYIFGSSNLTEAGIGLKANNNIELNMVNTATTAEYTELLNWFNEDLWKSFKAHEKIEINKKEVWVKQYLINEIQKIFNIYSPREIYYKILFHLWGDKLKTDFDDPQFAKQIGKLENTIIYNALYMFQQKAVLSLIKMLQSYNGAILADAVGLGKTWTALAVIKFFEFEGYNTILISPKKLQRNWEQFLEVGNRFHNDGFRYKIRFHSDLCDNLWERYTGSNALPLKMMLDDSPKLIVIDESHNLRNDKSQRYKWLVEEILKKCKGDVKVLMLSATPINNSFLDIKNQFKLMVRDDSKGFNETLGIRNIDYTFRTVHNAFNIWRQEKNRNISSFIRKIEDSDFFKMNDALTVARTRKMVLSITDELKFPEKAEPKNIRVTPKEIGNFDSFEELFEKFPPMLSAYQPSFYLPQDEDVDVIHNEKQRDFFLVKMMYILLVKRLESSWFSFMSTTEKIRLHHQTALDRIKEYELSKKDNDLRIDDPGLFDEDDETESDFEELALGKNRKVKLSEIDRAGKLNRFKDDLKKDLSSLDNLITNLDRFKDDIKAEANKLNNHKSKDEKLEALIQLIVNKRKTGSNNNNQKVLIFTVFRDTALYLFDQLKARGFDKLAIVSGSDSKSSYFKNSVKKFEPILEQFAPFTKLFNEKEWVGFEFDKTKSRNELFKEWKEWIKENDNEQDVQYKIDNPIDILIATDCLSEGQNLQDCDFVVNYDIHWNPVRVLQRCGRIDRLGSPNDIIYSANFWPTDNINTYLNLENRIEDRMIAMKMAGSEVDKDFTEKLKKKINDDRLDDIQTKRMLEQMETNWEDIERSQDTLGFDSFSLELYRQDLLEELLKQKDKYENMPNAIFSGISVDDGKYPQKSLVALLGYPARQSNNRNHVYKSYELIFIDSNGKPVLINQKEILDNLINLKDIPRDDEGLEAIDRGDSAEIQILADALKGWLKSNSTSQIVNDDGETINVMGTAALDNLNALKKGKKEGLQMFKENTTIEEKYSEANYDLITWLKIN